MPELWRVLDLSSADCTLKSVRGGLEVVRGGATSVTVPVTDIACVLLGPNVSMKSGIFHRLTQSGSVVLFCDWRGVPEGAAFSWKDHSRIGARRRSQAALTLPRQKNAWKQIVKEKVRNQALTLEALGSSGVLLRDLANTVRSGDPSNVEGQAARFYWKQLFGDDFIREQQTCNGINGMLDYAYTIARGHAVRAVLSAGLEPSLGIFHRHRENMFSLADDILEVVRPAVDYGVACLMQAGSNEVTECRAGLVAVAGATFSNEGYTIPSVLDQIAKEIGRYCEGDTPKIDIPPWCPPKECCCGR